MIEAVPNSSERRGTFLYQMGGGSAMVFTSSDECLTHFRPADDK